eukprot:1315626-Ditylum_brightwellii.AAC.1
MFKPHSMTVKDYSIKKKAQEDLFCHMLNFGARSEWRRGKCEVSMYLDVAVSPDQCRLLNQNTLETIPDYIMEDTKGGGTRKHLPARRLNIIDGCISSWLSMLNSREKKGLIRQSNELAKVLGKIKQDKEENKEKKQ